MADSQIDRRSALAGVGMATGALLIAASRSSACEPGDSAKAAAGKDRSMAHDDERAELLVDEFPIDFRSAFHAAARTDPQIEFLRYLAEDLPGLLRDTVDSRRVWVEFRDSGPTVNNCRTLEVGEENLPKQSRNHKHSNTDWRFETRSVKKKAYIVFCHPTIDAIWDDVRGCAIGAASAAIVAAILAENYETAEATFYPLFYACLVSRIGDRAREVSVDTRADTEHGCWENHC